MRKRVVALDQLRGVMAVAVMVYHYTAWSIGTEHGSLLAKLGLYAVAVFYILSGLSLTLAYRQRLSGPRSITRYSVRRLFRIAPLFWLATTGAIAIEFAASFTGGVAFELPAWKVLANYTLTFGFFAPGAYFATGAWSIGNEIVFYAAFPLALLIARAVVGRIVLAIFGVLSLYLFAFHWLSPSGALEGQWVMYINPLNQFPFFIAGMLIAYAVAPRKFSWGWTSAASAAAIAFWLVPVGEEPAALATGPMRIILAALCMTAVLGLYASSMNLRGWSNRMFGFLGEASYSIQLLHPLVAFPIKVLAQRLGVEGGSLVWVYFGTCVPLTLLASWLSYRFLERPGIRLGRIVTDGVSAAPPQQAVRLEGVSRSS